MALAEVQRQLAASLAAGSPAPSGCDPRRLERARRALEAKRRRAAGHLLPRLRAELGDAWPARFAAHARSYGPAGNLHHVDDAWELAAALRAHEDPAVAAAARDDLVSLRLRFVRDRNAGAGRIRERRSPLVAVTSAGRIVVRLPGAEARVFELRWRREAPWRVTASRP